MIGRRQLSTEAVRWNRRWGAPNGKVGARIARKLRSAPERFPRASGPFAFQPNSATRRFEYPWAFAQCEPVAGTRIIDIGGALSGLPFVLDRCGAHVVIVDPFTDYGPTNSYRDQRPTEAIARMNRAFRTDVEVITTTLDQAGLATGSVDTAVCVSVIEHLGEEVRNALVREIDRVLAPGGRAVFTVDLFLDVAPFTTTPTNQYGSNIDVRALIDESGMELVVGDRSELYGFPEFDPAQVLADRDRYFEGRYPVLPQAFVLSKREA